MPRTLVAVTTKRLMTVVAIVLSAAACGGEAAVESALQLPTKPAESLSLKAIAFPSLGRGELGRTPLLLKLSVLYEGWAEADCPKASLCGRGASIRGTRAPPWRWRPTKPKSLQRQIMPQAACLH